MAAFALTIFTGAFLLFQVQPLIGKYILPWFGGGPGVWTTCMLFFQLLLLAGYAYAHFTSRYLQPRPQVILHLVLLLSSIALLPIIPGENWKPQGADNPTWRILGLLAATIGLPYFVLSTTGPLMQQWFSRTMVGRSPYRLYALSNAGSLLALVSFPFFFETQFTRRTQAGFWGWGLVFFVVACAYCGVKLWKVTAEQKRTVEDGAGGDSEEATALMEKPTPMQKLLWLLLPTCASVLLLATTNKLCQDVAVIPFLWVLPLGLYLLSFIICFDNPRWYVRVLFTLAGIASVTAVCHVLFEGTDATLDKQVLAYSSALFACSMVCHGELYRLRPHPEHLTFFYFMIAAGGALGGVLVAVGAPLMFTDYHELHWGFLFCAALILLVWVRELILNRKAAATAEEPRQISGSGWLWMAGALSVVAFVGIDQLMAWLGAKGGETLKILGMNQVSAWLGVKEGQAQQTAMTAFRILTWSLIGLWAISWFVRKKHRTFHCGDWLSCGWMLVGLTVLSLALWKQAWSPDETRIYANRNFYGVLTVFEYRKDDPKGHYFLLQHGGITHGLQFVHPRFSKWPTTYYGQGSGVFLAVDALPASPRRIGLVGLGTGTLAALGRPEDYFRIYEINPEVQRIATSHFTYLSNCPSKVDIILGDARLSLEREESQQFDLLVLDAFSSDAIPVHLLTRQALELYQRHLKTNGTIAVHISNHYLDLEPVVVTLARHFNYKLVMIDYDDEEAEADWWLYSSTWLLLSHNDEIINSPAIRSVSSTVTTNQVPLWTDDFASLFQILKRD